MSTKSGNSSAPVQKYGKIVLTLENVLLPSDKLSPSPSSLDGLDADTEYDLRVLGCELIQVSGILLKLPQVAMACGQVLFQRMYYAKSLVRYPMEATAMACIALASKIEEAPRKIRDVINVFRHIRQVRNSKPITPIMLDQNYSSLKNQVIKAERRVLKELGFCCHVKHPHKMIIMYLRLLEAEENRNLARTSWNYMNDALRTDVFLRFAPEPVAASCIWLAARMLKYPLPENPPWYHVINTSIEEIHQISASILKLYTRPKVKLETLEAKVEKIRTQQQNARLKNKMLSATQQTPVQPATNNFSPSTGATSRNQSPSGSKQSHSRKDEKSRSDLPADSNNRRDESADLSRSSNNYKKRSASHSSESPELGGRTSKKRRSVSRDRSRSRSRSRSKHRRSRSRSRSRNSRDRNSRYYKRDHSKSQSKSSSPNITPPPRFIKNKDKGSIVKSMSRSRSRSPVGDYDKYGRQDKYVSRKDRYHNDKYEEKRDKYAMDRHDLYDKKDKYSSNDSRSYEKNKTYDKYDSYDRYSKSENNGKSKSEYNDKKYKYEKSDKHSYEKLEKYEKHDKYSKYDKYESSKKIDNGYDKHEKSSKSKKSRHRSRSRDRRR